MKSEREPLRELPNNPINPMVVPVTRLARARRAPVAPTGYRVRWAHYRKPE
jgi:hypothetical protein